MNNIFAFIGTVVLDKIENKEYWWQYVPCELNRILWCYITLFFSGWQFFIFFLILSYLPWHENYRKTSWELKKYLCSFDHRWFPFLTRTIQFKINLNHCCNWLLFVAKITPLVDRKYIAVFKTARKQIPISFFNMINLYLHFFYLS